MTAVLPASESQDRLRSLLFDKGVLVDSGVPGVVGLGAAFVRVCDGVDALITRTAAPEQPERMAFPPVMPWRLFESSGYLRSFPHLAASVWSFDGTEPEALEQADALEHGGDWGTHQRMTQVALVPAACHPVYPAVGGRGPLPGDGVLVDAGAAYVFRHEPSLDPARLQSFRQREMVRIGPAQVVLDWRDRWRAQAVGLLGDLGLDVELAEANDPFFGRSGRLLAANQRAQALKFEVLADITAPVRTAVASFNYHLDHFTTQHRITLQTGEAAHTACLGFGLERIALGLFAAHGVDLDGWPAPVRERLWG